MTYTLCGHKVPYEDKYIKDKKQAENNIEILESLKEYIDILSTKLGNISSWASYYQVGKWKSHPFGNYKSELDTECTVIDEYITDLEKFITLCENKITLPGRCPKCIELLMKSKKNSSKEVEK